LEKMLMLRNVAGIVTVLSFFTFIYGIYWLKHNDEEKQISKFSDRIKTFSDERLIKYFNKLRTARNAEDEAIKKYINATATEITRRGLDVD
jgi:hypothetical protein